MFNVCNFKVVEAIDDTGASMKAAGDAWEGVPSDGWLRDFFTLGSPGKGATKIAKLKMTADYYYTELGPADTVTIEFADVPLPGAEK